MQFSSDVAISDHKLPSCGVVVPHVDETPCAPSSQTEKCHIDEIYIPSLFALAIVEMMMLEMSFKQVFATRCTESYQLSVQPVKKNSSKLRH